MIKRSRQKEDQLLGQIVAMVGYLEDNGANINPDSLEAAWRLFERRAGGVRYSSGGLIMFLKSNQERVERGDAGPVEVAELILKVEGAWGVLCRRSVVRNGK